MNAEIPIGTAHAQDWPVLESHTVRAWGSIDLPVLATPFMIFMLEDTCVALAKPFLDAGEVTVGTSVHVDHLGTAEAGQSLSVLAELVSVRKRRLVFRVEARCGRTVVGRGLHERAVVDMASFVKGA